MTHFVAFSAEAYLYARSDVFIANQLAFLRADLAAVDRKATPWVVALVHKDWTMAADAFADIAPILDAAKVDVLFCGCAGVGWCASVEQDFRVASAVRCF